MKNWFQSLNQVASHPEVNYNVNETLAFNVVSSTEITRKSLNLFEENNMEASKA